MNKSRAEQETIIRRAADEQSWEVFSEDPRIIRKLKAIHGAGKPKGGGWLWSVPPNGLSFRRPRTASAATIERARANMAAMHAAKKAKKAAGGGA